MKFAGKVAVVTGGSRDIGRAVCVKLASEGASVVVNYNSNEADADAALKAIEAVGGKGGGRADMAQGGGADPGGLQAALEQVPSWVESQLG